MTNLYYYNGNGKKVGPITPAALQVLAQRSLITPTTTIENDKGQTTHAKNLPGLTFPGSTQPGSAPQNVPVSHTKGFWATMASTMRTTMNFIASVVGFILVLLLCGVVVGVLWWLWGITHSPIADRAVPLQPPFAPLELKGDTNYVDSARFSPDGTKILTGGGDNTVQISTLDTTEASLVSLSPPCDCRSKQISNVFRFLQW